MSRGLRPPALMQLPSRGTVTSPWKCRVRHHKNRRRLSHSEADVEAKIAEAKAAWEAEQQEKQRLAKLPPEERAKAEGEAQAQELTKLRTELLQRDLKDAAVKKLTDEGFPVGLADLLTYTDKESMEKSLQQTQEVFKSALEAAVKERLRGKTPEGLGGGAKAENTVKDQIAQGIRGGMM